jgi:hypothetical protein
MTYYGSPKKCPICGGKLIFEGDQRENWYKCEEIGYHVFDNCEEIISEYEEQKWGDE